MPSALQAQIGTRAAKEYHGEHSRTHFQNHVHFLKCEAIRNPPNAVDAKVWLNRQGDIMVSLVKNAPGSILKRRVGIPSSDGFADLSPTAFASSERNVYEEQGNFRRSQCETTNSSTRHHVSAWNPISSSVGRGFRENDVRYGSGEFTARPRSRSKNILSYVIESAGGAVNEVKTGPSESSASRCGQNSFSSTSYPTLPRSQCEFYGHSQQHLYDSSRHGNQYDAQFRKEHPPTQINQYEEKINSQETTMELKRTRFSKWKPPHSTAIPLNEIMESDQKIDSQPHVLSDLKFEPETCKVPRSRRQRYVFSSPFPMNQHRREQNQIDLIQHPITSTQRGDRNKPCSLAAGNLSSEITEGPQGEKQGNSFHESSSSGLQSHIQTSRIWSRTPTYMNKRKHNHLSRLREDWPRANSEVVLTSHSRPHPSQRMQLQTRVRDRSQSSSPRGSLSQQPSTHPVTSKQQRKRPHPIRSYPTQSEQTQAQDISTVESLVSLECRNDVEDLVEREDPQDRKEGTKEHNAEPKKQSSNSSRKNTYKCEHCSKVFGTRYGMMRHQRTHTGERPFECDICGKKFRQNVHLMTHRRARHEKCMAYEFLLREILNSKLAEHFQQQKAD